MEESAKTVKGDTSSHSINLQSVALFLLLLCFVSICFHSHLRCGQG